MRLCYDFKEIFRKSQSILEKYIFLNTSDWDNIESSEIIRLEIQESLNGKVSSDGSISSNEEDIADDGNSTKSSLKKLNNLNNTIRSRTKGDVTEICVEVDEYKVRRSKHRCTKCSKRCLNAEMLQKHMKSCTDTGTYECDLCTLRFDTKKQKIHTSVIITANGNINVIVVMLYSPALVLSGTIRTEYMLITLLHAKYVEKLST